MGMRIVTVLSVMLLGLAMTPAHALTMDYELVNDENLSSDIDIFSTPRVAFAPPSLPVYAVPLPPAEGLVWQPGYWRWDGYGYFWVPGTWVEPPIPGVLWTPGYWAWDGYAYQWYEGYWAQTVGYYGGIQYGGGYDGVYFYGGNWSRGRYVHNPLAWKKRSGRENCISFNGGPGGVTASPSAQQRTGRGNHFEMTQAQREHTERAAGMRGSRGTYNHGKPPVAATPRAGDFNHGRGARSAGPLNTQARAHDEKVRQNPALAGDAALPRVRVALPVTVQPQATAQPVPQQVQPTIGVMPPAAVRNRAPIVTDYRESPVAVPTPQVPLPPNGTGMRQMDGVPQVQSGPQEQRMRIGTVPAMPRSRQTPVNVPKPVAPTQAPGVKPVAVEPRVVQPVAGPMRVVPPAQPQPLQTPASQESH